MSNLSLNPPEIFKVKENLILLHKSNVRFSKNDHVNQQKRLHFSKFAMLTKFENFLGLKFLKMFPTFETTRNMILKSKLTGTITMTTKHIEFSLKSYFHLKCTFLWTVLYVCQGRYHRQNIFRYRHDCEVWDGLRRGHHPCWTKRPGCAYQSDCKLRVMDEFGPLMKGTLTDTFSQNNRTHQRGLFSNSSLLLKPQYFWLCSSTLHVKR